MSGFQHDIAGGNGNLVATSVQSPNFDLATQTGWQITKAGAAYFFDLVYSGEFEGDDFIINTSGLFFYTSTPALGNLSASMVPGTTGGTDGEGNAYLPGVTSYEAFTHGGDNGYYATSLFQGQTLFAWNATHGGSYTTLATFGANPVTQQFIFGDLPIVSTSANVGDPTLITTDTGTMAGTYGTDWAASGEGIDGVQFTLCPDGWVQVLIDVHTTGATPSTTLCDIPADYFPAASVVAGTIVPYSSGTAYLVVAQSGGTLQLTVPNTNGVRYAGSFRYPGPSI
jgi:hypothetical protein